VFRPNDNPIFIRRSRYEGAKEVKKSTVICEEVATLSLPAKVTLPTLTYKRTELSPASVEDLPNMAKRISKIPPTAKSMKKEGNLSIRKTKTLLNNPSIKPEKRL